MKKNIKFLVGTILMFIIMGICTNVNAASATITASKSNVTEGESVTIKVDVNAVAWNLKVSGNGISENIAGVDMSEKNVNTVKNYTLPTSKAGTYTVKLTGDITDESAKDDKDYSEINKSVTVTVKPKPTPTPTPTPKPTTKPTPTPTPKPTPTPTTMPKPVEQKPTFTSVSKTVYTTGECNLRSTWSTSSSATTVAEGTELKLTGTSKETIGGYTWYRVEYKGATKYIASFLITETKPVENKKEENNSSSKTTNITEPKENNTQEKQEETKETNAQKEQEKTEVVGDPKKTVENETVEKNTSNESLGLSQLSITGVEFPNGFNPEIHSYELQLNAFVSNLEVNAIANKEDANVEVIGNENFVEGENNITILITSGDNLEMVTYQIKAIVPAQEPVEEDNLQFYLLCAVIVCIAIFVISIISSIYNKTKEKSLEEFENNDQKQNENLDEEDYKEKRIKSGKHSN